MNHLTIRIESDMKQRIDKLLEEKAQDEYYAMTGKKLTQSDMVRLILHTGIYVLENGLEKIIRKKKMEAET